MMREINGKPAESFGRRCHKLNIAAVAVRERAIMRGYDLDGWRLARLMRDASTDTQVNVAERKFDAWRQGNPA